MKRYLKLFFILAAMVFCMSTMVNAAPKLSLSNVSILKGEKQKLKVTGTKKKVKWSSKNKKIVSVSKKGVITGLKKGKTTIIAKVGKKTLKCRVKVEKGVSAILKRVEIVGYGVENAATTGYEEGYIIVKNKSKFPISFDLVTCDCKSRRNTQPNVVFKNYLPLTEVVKTRSVKPGGTIKLYSRKDFSSDLTCVLTSVSYITGSKYYYANAPHYSYMV